MAKVYNFPTKNKEDILENEAVSIEAASWWVCDEVPELYENLLTKGNAYKLEYDSNCDEYFFYDDQCYNVTYYLAVPGHFVMIDDSSIAGR